MSDGLPAESLLTASSGPINRLPVEEARQTASRGSTDCQQWPDRLPAETRQTDSRGPTECRNGPTVCQQRPGRVAAKARQSGRRGPTEWLQRPDRGPAEAQQESWDLLFGLLLQILIRLLVYDSVPRKNKLRFGLIYAQI